MDALSYSPIGISETFSLLTMATFCKSSSVWRRKSLYIVPGGPVRVTELAGQAALTRAVPRSKHREENLHNAPGGALKKRPCRPHIRDAAERSACARHFPRAPVPTSLPKWRNCLTRESSRPSEFCPPFCTRHTP